ncbi:MAG: hypothetical protein ACTSRU_17425 [Candidatus Hodarchaeales archaeon]
MITNLLFGLFLVMYFVFSAYTVYMVLIGKPKPGQEVLGRLVYKHGQAWIGIMIATSIVTLSFIFANVILKNIEPFIGK